MTPGKTSSATVPWFLQSIDSVKGARRSRSRVADTPTTTDSDSAKPESARVVMPSQQTMTKAERRLAAFKDAFGFNRIKDAHSARSAARSGLKDASNPRRSSSTTASEDEPQSPASSISSDPAAASQRNTPNFTLNLNLNLMKDIDLASLLESALQRKSPEQSTAPPLSPTSIPPSFAEAADGLRKDSGIDIQEDDFSSAYPGKTRARSSSSSSSASASALSASNNSSEPQPPSPTPSRKSLGGKPSSAASIKTTVSNAFNNLFKARGGEPLTDTTTGSAKTQGTDRRPPSPGEPLPPSPSERVGNEPHWASIPWLSQSRIAEDAMPGFNYAGNVGWARTHSPVAATSDPDLVVQTSSSSSFIFQEPEEMHHHESSDEDDEPCRFSNGQLTLEEQRGIFFQSHGKLVNPRRTLLEQVLISNLMLNHVARNPLAFLEPPPSFVPPDQATARRKRRRAKRRELESEHSSPAERIDSLPSKLPFSNNNNNNNNNANSTDPTSPIPTNQPQSRRHAMYLAHDVDFSAVDPVAGPRTASRRRGDNKWEVDSVSVGMAGLVVI